MPGERTASEPETDDAQRPWQRRVPWWRRGLAVAALVISGLATTWFIEQSAIGGVGIFLTFLAAIPVFATAQGFGRVTLAIALALLLLAVLGVLLNLFIYLPVAIMLLLAYLADPGARPRTAIALAGLDCAIIMVMTLVWSVAVYRSG
ncbi:MAG TPA: hypothetical protein VIV12_10290 [Streptosporangiaceae bacterium]